MESGRRHRNDSAAIKAFINAHPGLTYAAASVAVNLISYGTGTFDIIGWKTNVSALLLPLLASTILHICGHIKGDQEFALGYGLLLAAGIVSQNILQFIIQWLPLIDRTMLLIMYQSSYCLLLVLALYLLCGGRFVLDRGPALVLYSLARGLLFGVVALYLHDRLAIIMLGILPSFLLGAYVFAPNPSASFPKKEGNLKL
jgi:hypothetical protein